MKTASATVTLCLAIINACYVGDSDTVKTGRISSERNLFRNLNAVKAEVEAELGANAAEHGAAIMVISTLGSAHHEYHTVLKAAQRIARAIELPGLLTEAAALGIEVRNPKGIPVRALEGLINTRRGELFRQTRVLNGKARDLVVELTFLGANLSNVPAIADPDKGISNSELVVAREVADKLEVALREKLKQHVDHLRAGRVTELFVSKRSAILLRGTHNLKQDLDRAKREAEQQVDNEMRKLWDAFQASRKETKNAPAAPVVASSEPPTQQA